MQTTSDKAPPTKRTVVIQRTIAIVFVCLLVAAAVAVRAPQMTSLVRFILVSMLAFGALTALAYLIPHVSSHPRLLYPMLFVLGLAVVWAVMADRPPKHDMLQQRYLSRLRTFDGVPYVRRGETERGVDGAGLARVAMWQAMLHEGFKEMNPRLLGPRFWRFWWHDLSSLDILEGKHGYTRVIGHAARLAGYDAEDKDSPLSPGDLAVTMDSPHALIYLGDNRWIDAAPDLGEVVISEAPADSDRPWHQQPVTFLRWRIFDEARAKR